MRRSIVVILFVAAVGVFASGVWIVGYRAALTQVAEQGRVYLRSASDRLTGQLARYREIAVMLADHPQVVALAHNPQIQNQIEELLLRTTDLSGALEIGFISSTGRLAATSAIQSNQLGFDQSPHFQRAMSGALGFDHSILPESQSRVFNFMAPVHVNGKPSGALMVRVDMETVEESDWRSAAQVVFFTDDDDQVFVTNRSELLTQAFSTEPTSAGFSPVSTKITADHHIWRMARTRFLPERAIYLEFPQPVIGLTGRSLISVAPAQRTATLQALAAAAICLTFGAFLFLAMERRRALAEANAQLEARVAERTLELTNANTNLRHEIRERKEAEAALRRAQVDLVRAEKLTALGKMSAGISHELNQPLMAIRSFSENAAVFLDKNKTPEARANLVRIGDLSRRMARIIKNLRAFAKQEHEPATDVNVIEVISAVLDLSRSRLDQDDIDTVTELPDGPVWVYGGEVRLQQVITNLITNAADAMMEMQKRCLSINVTQTDDRVQVTINDTGPGLADPDRVFDPFYTTKEVGGAEGMGLGLSISYGLVQSFGGIISGRNREEGGASFVVELARGTQRGNA